jgi:hypothetical protein
MRHFTGDNALTGSQADLPAEEIVLRTEQSRVAIRSGKKTRRLALCRVARHCIEMLCASLALPAVNLAV